MKTFATLLFVSPAPLLFAVTGVDYPSSGEGNTNSVAPFSYTIGVRYQQVYESRRFSALQPGGEYLSHIFFRFDGPPAGHASSGTYTNVQISVSTTSNSESSLNPVFAQNVGSDAAVIFAGTLSWGGPYSPGAEPQPWELVLRVDTPFVYNPAQGNLLFDFQGALSMTGPSGFGPLDAWRLIGDGTASLFAAPNSSMGMVDTIGLTTRFQFTPVPEPAAFLLLFVGGGGLWLVGTGARKRKDAYR